jgi:DHA2 family multidrug resistance protein
LRRLDSRWVVGAGLFMIGIACWITATHLTAQWAIGDFLGTLLLQAIGQTFAISGAVFTGVLNLKPASAGTFGVAIQVARLLGGELGTAFIVSFVRVREQVASNVIGTHVQVGDLDTLYRLHALGAGVASRSDGAGIAARRALGILAQSVRVEANLQACIDGFMAIAVSVLIAFALLLALERPPQGPASPNLRFGRPQRRRS